MNGLRFVARVVSGLLFVSCEIGLMIAEMLRWEERGNTGEYLFPLFHRLVCWSSDITHLR